MLQKTIFWLPAILTVGCLWSATSAHDWHGCLGWITGAVSQSTIFVMDCTKRLEGFGGKESL